MLAAPVEPQQVVWRSALGLSTRWMRFADNEQDAVRKLVKESWGVRYDGQTPYIVDDQAVWLYDHEGGRRYSDMIMTYGVYTVRFDLRGWLDDAQTCTEGECMDISSHLVLMAATVGIDADPLRAPPPGEGPLFYGQGPRWSGQTAAIQPAGGFNYHQVLDFGGVYDGCIGLPDALGPFYVLYGDPNEARIQIVLDWTYGDWIEGLWDPDPNPLPDTLVPDLVVYWP